jgi:hypothetical protein
MLKDSTLCAASDTHPWSALARKRLSLKRINHRLSNRSRAYAG